MSSLVKVSCHCRANVFNLALALPVSTVLCHCNACRHSTGQLMGQVAPIIGVPLASSSTSEPADLSTLTPYRSSSTHTRWFCGCCSAHMFWERNNYWFVTTGTLEHLEETIDYSTSAHLWVEDTLDGGIADHLPTISGVKLPRYATKFGGSDILSLDWKNLPSSTHTEQDCLYISCHCKSNTFYITRPTHASSLLFSPYPDLTHAYISHATSILLNPHDEKWWLRPLDSPSPTRYLAGHCACTSCRTSSGSPIQSWAFVPSTNIFFSRSGERHNDNDHALKLCLHAQEHRPPGLQHYASSKGRNREFCATCGATVFWWGEERPELVDVSVGLVDERQWGARAESWFEWWKGRVSFKEDAVDRRLVGALEGGLRASESMA